MFGNFSWGFTSKEKEEEEKKKKEKEDKKKKAKDKRVAEIETSETESEMKPDEKKKLEKFVTLRDIKFSVKKGEFISIIGDVGSGKSSLLQSIIGDLIYIPQSEID